MVVNIVNVFLLSFIYFFKIIRDIRIINILRYREMVWMNKVRLLCLWRIDMNFRYKYIFIRRNIGLVFDKINYRILE